MPDLLYEIGTEELPAGYLQPALEQLSAEIGRRLEEARIPAAESVTAGTPRRMTVAVRGIPELQPAQVTKETGPPARVAYDEDGNPTRAAAGFARKYGVTVESLEVEETDRGPYVVATLEEAGRPAGELLPDILASATLAVSFPKSMHWEPNGVLFARPIRWLVAMLDGDVLEMEIAGVKAGRETWGHPFLSDGPVRLDSADFDTYLTKLRESYVIADPVERREKVQDQIADLMGAHGSPEMDLRLLDEVTNMVEWPCAVEGSFDKRFLDVPASVLTAAMKEHQRYFPVTDEGGDLLPRFVTVTNRLPEQADQVRAGNERVLLARLEDARFFWTDDSETRLEEMVPRLADVVFLGGLGNNLERTERLVDLARRIADMMGADGLAEAAARAAYLCKADLLTGLVGEFPSLQGIVGRELAAAQGEPQEVADAIAEHYLPAGADDRIPDRPASIALALADKLDVIVGCFSVGLLPSGSQDPYALRRNALGVLLILEENGLALALSELVDAAIAALADGGRECPPDLRDDVLSFIRDRLYNAAVDRGFPHDFVRAVLAAGYDNVTQFWRRLDAIAACSRRDWWADLVELVDRTYRIQRDLETVVEIREELLSEAAEKELAEKLAANRDAVRDAFNEANYEEGARLYCEAFAEPVHEFFEDVFVNVDDEDVRLNRKSLCGWVYRLFAEPFADLYEIETTDRDA